MANSQQTALGLANMFKIIEKPTTADIINIHLQTDILLSKLGGYFSGLMFGDKTDTEIKDYLSEKPFSQKYLLVIGKISKALNTYLYMDKVLENDEIMPKYRIRVIGAQSDVTLTYGLVRYLNEMRTNLKNTLSAKLKLGARGHRELDMKIFNPLLRRWDDVITFSQAYTSTNRYLKIRDDKRLHYIINNLKFEYANNNKNPLYAKDKRYTLPVRAFSKGGKFKVHHIISHE